MTKRLAFIFFWTSIAIFFVLSGCSKKNAEKKSDTITKVPVEVITVENGSLKKILTYIGIIEAWKEVDIVPNIAGKIVRIYVKEDDRIKKGDPIAELDSESMKLTLSQTKANLQATQAVYEDAEKNLRRMEVLNSDGTVAPQQLEKAQLAFNSAQATVEQLKAAVDLVEYNLRVSTMRAPFDGIVTHKHLEEGDMINPNMGTGPGVVTFMDFSQFKIRILAPEIDLPFLKQGLPAEATVDSYPGEIFSGTIYIVSPASAKNSRLFEVQLKFPNSGMKLKPGMFARISIITEKHDNVVTLPLSAIMSQESDPYVFIVDSGKAVQRNVKIGIIQDELVEIVSGAQSGETVVSVGQQMLQDGTLVATTGGETE